MLKGERAQGQRLLPWMSSLYRCDNVVLQVVLPASCSTWDCSAALMLSLAAWCLPDALVHVTLVSAMLHNHGLSSAIFVMQASANTLLAHFASIVFTNLLLRTLNKATPSPKAAY